MANNIIQTKDLIQQLNDVLAKHTGYLDSAATSLNKYVSSAKLPSEYVNSLKGIEQNQKKIVKSTKDLERAEKKMQRERIKDLRLAKRREQAFDKYERQLQREQRLLNRTQGLYNKVQRGINEVTRKYQDLAVRKELNGKLSAEEEISLGRLEAKLNKYQSALKRVDANIGKHQRNVGNYKSGFDGLGFSVAQLSREMPAFANSMQTGFMAISNNIPMLVDEINRLKTANVQLAASGKPTTSIFKALGRAVFGWQTLISVGVTLLTIYGAKLVELSQGLFKASDSASLMAENTKKINEEAANILGSTVPKFKALVGISQDLTKTEEERLDAINEITKVYPDFNAEILKEKDNTELVNREVSNYIQILGKKAKAQAAMSVVQEKYAELIIKEQEAQKTLLEQGFENEEQFRKLDKERNERNQRTSAEEAIRFSNARRALKGLKEERDEINGILKVYTDNVDLSTIKEKENTTATRNNTSAKRENKEEQEDVFGVLEGTIPFYEQIITSLKNQQKELSRTSREWAAYQQQIDEFTDKLQLLKNDLQDLDTLEKLNIKPIDADAFIKGLGSDDTSETKQNFQNLFNSYVSIAQNAFGIISQLSENATNKQLSDLEIQKENALRLAGDSATAREEIEIQYEERRSKIQKKQAEAQKKQAMFNTVINTAQGIVAALGSTPPNPILAALVGAIGAAQLAVIQSQPIPQFWMGTEGTPGGQIMVNDDPYGVKGSNYKEVIKEPSGKLHFPQGKNVKMNVPKGSHVYSTYDAFINSLDNELLTNNIMPIGQSNIMPMVINNGLSRQDIQEVFSQEVNRLNKTINDKEVALFNYDERGAELRIKKKGKVTKVMNARYSGQGRSV